MVRPDDTVWIRYGVVEDDERRERIIEVLSPEIILREIPAFRDRREDIFESRGERTIYSGATQRTVARKYLLVLHIFVR